MNTLKWPWKVEKIDYNDENNSYYLFSCGRDSTCAAWDRAKSCWKFDWKFDTGLTSNRDYPRWATTSVIDIVTDSNYRTFALPEVEWCNTHCLGRFARRYGTKIEGSLSTPLNVMLFEKERDAKIFKVFLEFGLSNRHFLAFDEVLDKRNDLVKCDAGWVFSGDFFNKSGLDKSLNFKIIKNLQNWLIDNVSGDFILSVNLFDGGNLKFTKDFLFFFNENDAVLFKFGFLLAEDFIKDDN